MSESARARACVYVRVCLCALFTLKGNSRCVAFPVAHVLTLVLLARCSFDSVAHL